MATIDREYDRKQLIKRWAKTKTCDTCCAKCRRHYDKPPRCDRYKDRRRK